MTGKKEHFQSKAKSITTQTAAFISKVDGRMQWLGKSFFIRPYRQNLCSIKNVCIKAIPHRKTGAVNGGM